MKREEMIAAVGALNRYIRANNIADFRLQKVENGTLHLIGSFDLSYYYDVTIVITGLTQLSLSCEFYVDLLLSNPFALQFSAEDAAVLRFEDCSIRQKGEIVFEGGIMFHVKHTVLGD